MASDPSRIAFRQMMGVFAQFDKSMIVLKLAGARAKKRDRRAAARAASPSGITRAKRRLRSASRRSGTRVWGSTASPGSSTARVFRPGRAGRGTASS